MDDEAEPQLQYGGAFTNVPDEEPEDKPIGSFWVPDLEARHRWREKYVYPPKQKDTPKPKIGFRVSRKGK